MATTVRQTLFAGLAASLLLASAAHASDPPRVDPVGKIEPPPTESLSGVVVTPPRTVETTRYGVKSDLITMSVNVSYRDLDMRTPRGVAELDKRVAEAARYVCRQLDRLYPGGTPDTFYCAKEAIHDAEPQVILARAPA